VIALDGVAKRYHRRLWVLAGVDAELAPGRLAVLAGENGCGKSTLLRIVAGCTRPTRGRVRGRPPATGYVPERFPAELRLSAAAYLRHLAAVRGRSRVAPAGLLDRLGFAGDPDAPMLELSKGNAQKVALAQALDPHCRLLVLDEPWAGLDTEARAALCGLLGERVGDGVTALVTDHTGAAAGLPGATMLHLAGGRLTDALPGAGAPPAEMRLRCPDGVADHLAALAGVRSAVTERGLLVLAVDADRVDALLAEALRRGCSVRAVRTGDGGAP
jgi:ABC-type multidrug transport system ATPase subunit